MINNREFPFRFASDAADLFRSRIRCASICLFVTCAAVCFSSGGAPLFAQDEAAPVEPMADPASPVDVPPETTTLPKRQDLQVPSLETLLTQSPVDWVVLKNNDVLMVDSLAPRPDTLQIREQQIVAKEEERRNAQGEKRDQLTQEIDKLNTLIITLSQGKDHKEYQLPLKLVKEIIHHEDLMLRRLDTVIATNQLDQAFELLTRLQRERPDWKGIPEATRKFMLANARQRLQDNQPESALVILDELYTIDPRLPELSIVMGETVKALVNSALETQDRLKAQYFLNQFRSKFPKHEVYQQFVNQLSQQAAEQMQSALAASEQNEYRQAVIQAEQAVKIWPPLKNLRAPYRQLAKRYQRLHVGVTDLPGECVAYPLPSPADLRRDQLTRLTLFEIDRVRDGTAYYRTRFFDEWEPQDLGREMRFTLRQYRQPADLHAVLTTPQIVAPILRSLDPQDAHYNERLAACIESIDVRSPTEFVLTFRRVPPRMEPLLAELSLQRPDGESEEETFLEDPGGFRLQNLTSESCEYIRSLPEPNGLDNYHIAEVVEHRYSSPEKLVQGLKQGEVSMASGLPDVELRSLQGDDRFTRKFFIQPCMQPMTHLLQMNPDSKVLRISELRKGLAYAIDRDRLLRDVILEDPQARHGRLVTTPFSSKNPSRNVSVLPHRYDLSSGLAMILAARQKFKAAIPPLTMIVAPGAIPTAAAQDIANTWRRLGLEVNVVLADQPVPEKWDILYRTLQMSEPILEMWPFLTLQDQARIGDLDVYPDWMKQELVGLDRTGDQSRAVEALQKLHLHLWEDTAFIPLWEVDQFVVLRKNIRGFPSRFIYCYDHIDHWILDDWYQTELP